MDGEWPEFSIPDVGNEGGSQESEPGATGSPAPAAAAGAGGAEDGTKPPATGSPSAGDETIPKYRLDEITARYNELSETNKRLMAMLEKFQQPAAPAPKPAEPDPEAEKKERIWKQLLEVNPKLAKAIELAERAGDIESVMQAFAQQQQAQKQEWDNYAKSTLSTIHDKYASLLSNGTKKGADLPEETRQTITDNFVAWVMKDGTGQRVQRYNSKDGALIEEFVNDWKKTFIEPWRRQSAGAQAQQARRTQNLPNGGGTSSPLGTPPPKPKNDEDEDAIYHRAFRHSMSLKEQGDGAS